MTQPLNELIKELEKARLSMQTLYDLYKDSRARYDSIKSRILEQTKENDNGTN